jgi:hypothetical protein
MISWFQSLLSHKFDLYRYAAGLKKTISTWGKGLGAQIHDASQVGSTRSHPMFGFLAKKIVFSKAGLGHFSPFFPFSPSWLVCHLAQTHTLFTLLCSQNTFNL